MTWKQLNRFLTLESCIIYRIQNFGCHKIIISKECFKDPLLEEYFGIWTLRLSVFPLLGVYLILCDSSETLWSLWAFWSSIQDLDVILFLCGFVVHLDILIFICLCAFSSCGSIQRESNDCFDQCQMLAPSCG